MNIELWPESIKIIDGDRTATMLARSAGYDIILALVEEVMAYRKEKAGVSKVMRGGLAVIERLNALLHITGNKGIQTHESGQTVKRFEGIEPSMGIERIAVERSFNWTRTYYLDQKCKACDSSGDDGYGHRCSDCGGRGVRMESVAEENPISIVVNGKTHRILRDNLDFHAIAELAGLKGEAPSITYRGDKNGESGMLTPSPGSNWIGICEGMIFNVANTGNA